MRAGATRPFPRMAHPNPTVQCAATRIAADRGAVTSPELAAVCNLQLPVASARLARYDRAGVLERDAKQMRAPREAIRYLLTDAGRAWMERHCRGSREAEDPDLGPLLAAFGLSMP